VAARFPVLARGLEAAGLEQERRPLRTRVRELTWRLDSEMLELAFGLPAGAYATSVLREVVDVD
jgi:tRNA pseudouridine13 synthase